MTQLPEMKKCLECKCSFTLNFFRQGHNKCRECAQIIQNKNRREKYKAIGMRKDPTRLVSDIEAEAMKALYERCSWTQEKIGKAFNLEQSTVSANIRKLEAR